MSDTNAWKNAWKKAIVVRAFSGTGDFLGGTGFLRSLDDYSRLFERARSLGFDGVQLYLEISDGLMNLTTEDGVLNEVARRAQGAGVGFPSIELAPLQYSVTTDDPAERARGREVVKRALEMAARLGSTGVLFIPGYVGKMWDPLTDQVHYEDAWERTVSALQELGDRAAALRVQILLEPIWNMFLLSPLEVRQLIDRAMNPSCGVLLDTGNITLFGFAEQWIRILGTRIREIHMKDFRRQVGTINGFVPLLAGDVNWAAVTAAARQTGFSGYWIAEQFPYAHHGDIVLEHTATAMNRILACEVSSTAS